MGAVSGLLNANRIRFRFSLTLRFRRVLTPPVRNLFKGYLCSGMLTKLWKRVGSGRAPVTSRFIARITNELIFAAMRQHRFALIFDAGLPGGSD